jgi:hydrogenase maturation protease
MKADLLVIGYGNELRGDDGVGPAAARAVACWNLHGVRALDLHQLTPETADVVGQAGCVVFVDASVEADLLEVRELSEESGARATHASDPREVLALARLLHGRRPRAWLITVPAENLALGEGLSPSCSRCLHAALRHIRALAHRYARDDRP